MSEFPPALPTWLVIAILVVWAFFFGRWTVKRQQRGLVRNNAASSGLAKGDAYVIGTGALNAGAGVDPGPSGLDIMLETDLRTLLRQDRKIEAIKLARERLGLGLKDAKDLVERL